MKFFIKFYMVFKINLSRGKKLKEFYILDRWMSKGDL